MAFWDLLGNARFLADEQRVRGAIFGLTLAYFTLAPKVSLEYRKIAATAFHGALAELDYRVVKVKEHPEWQRFTASE